MPTSSPRPRLRRRVALTVLGVLAGLVPAAACSAQTAPDAGARSVPALRVQTLARDLATPWDVARLPQGQLLVTERNDARLLVIDPGRGTRTVVGRPSGAWVSGETGLMSVELDRGFARTGRFYTCQGWTDGARRDVRVVAWRLNAAHTRAREVGTLLQGIDASSGRHGGCRLLAVSDGSLLVGTGDAAVGRNPQDLRSLAGKTLRLDPRTGAPWATNPWVRAANLHRRYVWTYGHRNVQGLAERADGTLWSAEHGPNRDDEVNRLRRGGNYGWNPVPGYDESVPMTDVGLPGRQWEAAWRSGAPTLAVSGAAWVHGRRWGRLDGTLAVAGLKSSRLVFMRFDRAGTLRWTCSPEELQQDGRLRSVHSTPAGALLVTTSNGSADQVLHVTPRG